MLRNIEKDSKYLWVQSKGLHIYVHETDEGVVVDIFKKAKKGGFGDPIASTYAFWNE